MKKDKVIKHYGSAAKAARALGISRQAIEQWPETVPILRAYQIEVLTGGYLKAKEKRHGQTVWAKPDASTEAIINQRIKEHIESLKDE